VSIPIGQTGFSLTAFLMSSWVLRPFVALACLSPEGLARFLAGSGGVAVLGRLRSPLGQPASGPLQQAMAWGDGLGLLALGLSCLVFDTGVIGVVVWAWLLWLLALYRPPVHRGLSAEDVLLGLFLISALLSAGFSSHQPASLLGLGKLLTFAAGYVAFRLYLSRVASLPRTLWAIFVGLALMGLAEAAIGFYQYKMHIQPLATWEDPSVNPELRLTRIFGTLKPSNPNLLAGFLLYPLVGAGGWALRCFFTGRPWWGIVAGNVAMALTLALVLTGSRGGYLALATVALLALCWTGHLLWHDGSRLWQGATVKRAQRLWMGVLGLGGVGVLLSLLAVPALQHRVASMFAMREDSSTSFRLNVYQAAWQMFRDNWWLGIGPGNQTFKLVYGLYMIPGYTALSAYSVPLEIAVEQGVLGLLVFLLLVGTLKVRACLLLDDPQRSVTDKLLVGTLLAGLLGSLVYGMFDTIWYRPAVNLPFWFLVAAMATFSVSLFPKSETRSADVSS
jgi:putative inorganic carbon (HCO3(-)) transporter